MELQIFQTLVRRWVVRAFGEEVADDSRERTHRFLEEALELAQSTACSKEEAHALVEYVYGRPSGAPGQEVGGTMLTLAALCAARNLSLNVEALAEVTRVNRAGVLEQIRIKRAAKERDIPLSPLPEQIPLDTKCLVTGEPLSVAIERAMAAPDLWCPSCNATRGTYRAPAGDSAPGSVRCVRCSRILLTPKPDFTPSGQGTPPRTHTDAVGTTGGKATVSRLG